MFSTLFGSKKPEAPQAPSITSPVQASAASQRPDNISAAASIGGLNAPVPIPGAQIPFYGDPNNQVLVFDMDETLAETDWKKHNPEDPKVQQQIASLGDRELRTLDYQDQRNPGKKLRYVLRPGTKELLEYLHNKGHKIVLSTRNFGERLQYIVDNDPVLSQYVDGVLGMEDLKKDENKDFKKYPHHPDNLSFFAKLKAFFFVTIPYIPGHLYRKLKSCFGGEYERWSPGIGNLGKYPPNVIELLKQKGNNKLDACRPARFLVDNKASRESADAKRSKDWAWVNPNIDRNGDGKATPFYGVDPVPKYPDGSYVWVNNVIAQIEAGWQNTLKANTGAEAVQI